MVWVALALALVQDPGEAVYGWQDRSGARIQVRTFPSSKAAVLHLVVGTGGWAETPERHGFRHLLEHLVALGPSRDLDLKLEAAGGGLTADTYRDATHFRIWGPPGELRTLVAALKEVLRPPRIEEALLQRELAILREEEALRDSDSLAGAELWRMAFGDAGLDPFGDLDAMSRATPQQLQGLWSGLFVGGNMALIACVPDQARTWADEIRRAVVWPRGDARSAASVRSARPRASAASDRINGVYRAVPVRGMDSEETAEALAGALLLASKVEGSRVLYTPSDLPSLLIVGESRSKHRLSEAWRRLAERWQPADGAAAGRWAASWLEAQLRDPFRSGLWYGVAAVQGRAAAPDNLLERLRSIDPTSVRRGLLRFADDAAFCLTGEGK